ncbi:MAG: hypothetical protein PHT60_14910 [Acidiphilium sp.]|nr:hypothetical protein [Acidiphilium sp.]MDD4937052.1 hypothetical protein [Acidiphilium sp.]
MPDLNPIALAAWTAGFGLLLEDPIDPDRDTIEADAPCENAVLRFGAALDRALDGDPQLFSEAIRSEPDRPLLAGVLARISLARQARVIDWLASEAVPNGQAIMRALATPGPDGTGDAIRQSVGFLHRQQLLRRIFSSNRLAALLEACRIAQDSTP